MRVRRWSVVAVLGTVVAGWWAASAPPAAAKSYHFTRVSIDATVLPDGSLRLVEQRTFDFQGHFSAADYVVDWPRSLIQRLQVSEGGMPVDTSVGGNDAHTRASWSFSAANEQRTWTIAYTAECAVRVYTDAAHLLWEFVGNWGVPTDRVDVTVHLPNPARRPLPRPGSCPAYHGTDTWPTRPMKTSEVHAWGHGPANGDVALPDPNTVTLSVTDLAGDAYVEGSILFPPASVPLAHAKDRAAYADIIAIERRLARRANAARRREEARKARAAAAARRAEEAQLRAEASAAARRERMTRWVGVVALGLVALGALLIFVGRRREHVTGMPRALDAPPSGRHPVEVAMLWSAYRGHLSPKTAYRTEILNLAATGVVDLEAVGTVSDPTDLMVRLKKRPVDEGPDRDFASFLFPEAPPPPAPTESTGTAVGVAPAAPSVSLNTLAGSGSGAISLRRWWRDAQGKAAAGMERIRSGRMRGVTVMAWIAGVIGAVFGLAALLAGAAAGLGVIVVAAGMVVVVLRWTPPHLPADLREEMAGWLAFRSYLRNFSSLPDAPAMAVVIWERYLVYAVALDVADEVASQVRALVPSEELNAPWPGGPKGIDPSRTIVLLTRSAPSFAIPRPAMNPLTGSGHGGWRPGGGSHSAWSASGFGHMSSGAGFGGGFGGMGHGGGGFGGGLGGGGGGGTHGGAH